MLLFRATLPSRQKGGGNCDKVNYDSTFFSKHWKVAYYANSCNLDFRKFLLIAQISFSCYAKIASICGGHDKIVKQQLSFAPATDLSCCLLRIEKQLITCSSYKTRPNGEIVVSSSRKGYKN